MPRILSVTATFLLSLFISITGYTADQMMSVGTEDMQTTVWNKFANTLYRLHKNIANKNDLIITSKHGSYGGELFGHINYNESEYVRKEDNLLISRIRKIKGGHGNFHTLEVYIYDEQGRVTRDYVAAYLPKFRNAPYQTLINLHYYDDDLHAYRQFDASGRRIFESCNGSIFNEEVELLLEDYEIPDHISELDGALRQEAYRSCFGQIPKDVGMYIDPMKELLATGIAGQTGMTDQQDQLISKISSYSKILTSQINNIDVLMQRGDAYFTIHEFDKAVADYSRVIAVNPSHDAAYFGRGMALGRAGELEAAIRDLSVYIKRNPKDSRAYTKRGVRYIWHGKLDLAQHDLEKAVALDHTNSEAHDDLGVIYSQRKDFAAATNHFMAAIKHDPGYQKAYHNLATAYYINNEMALSLKMVNQSLRMLPHNRDSLMLKGLVLKSLGRNREASALIDEAEFLPDGNWSERFSLE